MAGQSYAVADGIQALKVVREHTAEWGIDPNKVGFVGFSAGGMVTAGTLLQADAASRPNFAAPIYGAPFGAPPILAGLPPIFLAWAEDDALMGPAAGRFQKALIDAGYNPETHVKRAEVTALAWRKQAQTAINGSTSFMPGSRPRDLPSARPAFLPAKGDVRFSHKTY
jgi:acetyl esterase/lipase